MAQPTQTARKWNGFVCSDCRHVFRVARDHDGKGVVCPSCHRLLRLPGDQDAVPPLVIPHHEPEQDEQDETERSPLEPGESGLVKKRRRKSRNSEEIFDETFARKEEVSPKLTRGLLGSMALFGAILLVALLWPSGDESESEESLMPNPVVDDNSLAEKDAIQIEAERAVVRPKLVEEELLPVFMEFLNAESPEEMARWVRHPEVTLPRMREFYGDDFAPDGFSSIMWSNHPMRIGHAIKVIIEDGDYTKREIHAVDEGGWKIDWESWVGWSELSWEELKATRTTEPVMFRVVVSDVSYFNYSFSDEGRWSSYRLESKDGESSLYGYVPRAGELDSRLKSFDQEGNRQFVLKIRYPEDAPSASQVIVEEVVTEGWLLPDDPS